MTWAIRRRNGGVDINEEMSDDPSLFGSDYGQWVPICRASEAEHLREAVAAMQARGKTYPPLSMALYIDRLEDALSAIVGPEDNGAWIEVYREAGGGYEGLQAIAREALEGRE